MKHEGRCATLTGTYFLKQHVFLHFVSFVFLFCNHKGQIHNRYRSDSQPLEELGPVCPSWRSLGDSGSPYVGYAGPRSPWHKNVLPVLPCTNQVNSPLFFQATPLHQPSLRCHKLFIRQAGSCTEHRDSHHGVPHMLCLLEPSPEAACKCAWSFLDFPPFLFSSSAPVFNHGLPGQRGGQA